MNIFSSTLRRVGAIILIILTVIAAFLYYINQRPIIFSINSKYSDSINIIAEKAVFTFADYQIQITAPILQVITNNQITSLSDASLRFDAWLLTSKFSANLKQTEVLALVDEDVAKHNVILFDGEVKASFILHSLAQANIDITSKNGWHEPLIKGLNKINLQECDLSLLYKSSILTVQKFTLKYDNGLSASLAGDFILDGQNLESANFKADITALPVNFLQGLWPKILFPEIHDWVASHVKDGMVTKANGVFNFTEEDMRKANSITQWPTKESVEAEIEVAGVNLNYLEGYNSIKDINGKIKFDASALYLAANHATILAVKLTDLELKLPLDSFVVSMKAGFNGPIKDFQEFIHEDVRKKITTYNIYFEQIKGSIKGKLDLELPIKEEFSLADLKLEIKANVDNLVLDKLGLMRIKAGSIDIINDKDKISLKLNERNIFAFELTEYHALENKHQNRINANLTINLAEKTSFNILDLNSGVLKIKADLSKDNWHANFDVSDAEVYVAPLGYTKLAKVPVAIECSGKIEPNLINGDNCQLKGKGFGGKISFGYLIEENRLAKLVLNKAIIDKNDFSFSMSGDKNSSSYVITAKSFDISKINFGYLALDKDIHSNYQLNFKIDKLICKNDVNLDDFKGYIKKNGNNPVDINISSISLKDNSQLTIAKAVKNGEVIYVLHGAPAAQYTQGFGIYNNIKKGEVWIELSPKKMTDHVSYQGTLRIEKFNFTNTSILSKVILGILSPFNSPMAIINALQGGSLRADSFVAKLNYDNGMLSMKDGLISGPSYSVKIHGDADFNSKKVNFKGIYIPSAYGINTIISSIPFLGTLLAGGKDSALIGADFSISGSFDNPKTNFNPLSIFTPGFLRYIIP